MDSNFWNLRVNDRLSKWKDFRRELDGLALPDAIEQVNQLWSTAPFISHYLTPDDTKNWPDPWTLLAENYWCDVAKSLGIVYTLYFTQHRNVPMEIRTYYDHGDNSRSTVAWINRGKYILNYWPYEIVNTETVKEKELKLLYQYSTKDLALDKY
jgi:hypothetical protein